LRGEKGDEEEQGRPKKGKVENTFGDGQFQLCSPKKVNNGEEPHVTC